MAVHDKSAEYCYRTKSPKCGKDVFRGRYNGGIYWVESLGDTEARVVRRIELHPSA